MDTVTLLEAENLSKHYAEHAAVNALSFTIRKGEVLGFLGPNGAGKTTTMKMLTGNLSPDSGRIVINGIDLLDNPKAAKAHIGYLPENPPLYKELTVREFLQFCARLNHIPVNDRSTAVTNVIQRCGLTDFADRLIANLSKGYQQRVGIAQAIIHSPAVVILDEPTSGLDPIQIREIRQLIRDVAKEHSVILSTHILPEVQMLCDKVQIISQGELLFSDHIDSLTAQMQSTTLLVEFDQAPHSAVLENIAGVDKCEQLSARRFRIHYTKGFNPTPAILQTTVNQGWSLTMLSPEQHSLEEVFMKLIQKEDSDV